MHHPRQLTLLLDPEPADNSPGPALQDGTCPVCGASLGGHRSDAVYCGAPCRAEASRVRRLRQGQATDGLSGPGGLLGPTEAHRTRPTRLLRAARSFRGMSRSMDERRELLRPEDVEAIARRV